MNKKFKFFLSFLMCLSFSFNLYAECTPAAFVIRHGEDSDTGDTLLAQGVSHAKAYISLFQNINNYIQGQNICPIVKVYSLMQAGKVMETAQIIAGTKNTTCRTDILRLVGNVSGLNIPCELFKNPGLNQMPALPADGSIIVVLNRQTIQGTLIQKALASGSTQAKYLQKNGSQPFFNRVYMFTNQTQGGFDPFKNVTIFEQQYPEKTIERNNFRITNPNNVKINKLAPIPES